MLRLALFYRWGNGASERLNDFLKITGYNWESNSVLATGSQVSLLQPQAKECRGGKERERSLVLCPPEQQSAIVNCGLTYRNRRVSLLGNIKRVAAFITPLRDLIQVLNDQINYKFIYWFTDPSRIYWALARYQTLKQMPKWDMNSAFGELALLTHIKVTDHMWPGHRDTRKGGMILLGVDRLESSVFSL